MLQCKIVRLIYTGNLLSNLLLSEFEESRDDTRSSEEDPRSSTLY